MKVTRKAEVRSEGVRLIFKINGRIISISPLFGGIDSAKAEEWAEFFGVTKEEILDFWASEKRPWIPLPDAQTKVNDYSIICPPDKNIIKYITDEVINNFRSIKKWAESKTIKGWLREEMVFEI